MRVWKVKESIPEEVTFMVTEDLFSYLIIKMDVFISVLPNQVK